MTWESIRAHYAQRFAALGATQETVAKAGALSRQNAISKMLKNHHRGPTVQTFIRAIYGLGITPAAFFADLEAAAPPDRSVPDASSAQSGAVQQPTPEPTFEEIVAARFEAIEQDLRRLDAVTHDLEPPWRTKSAPAFCGDPISRESSSPGSQNCLRRQRTFGEQMTTRRQRQEPGHRLKRGKWQVFVRVNGVFRSKTFDLESPVEERRAWRDAQIATTIPPPASGTFAADVVRYLALPEVAARPTVDEIRTQLQRWVHTLGADRSRHSITTEDVEAVLQDWLRTLAPATVYHRRSTLRSFFKRLDKRAGPIEGTTCPAHYRPVDRSVPFETLTRILDAMPDERFIRTGIRRPSFAKLRVAVILHTAIPPAELMKLRARDFDREAAIVRMPWRDKGAGTPAHRLELSPAGVAAFIALDAAGAWGSFPEEAVTHSFKRAARKVCGADTPIRLYDLRHSLGADAYEATKDLATVGRLLGHVPGSIVTSRYALGAHAAVDRAAVAAITAARGNTESALKLPAKIARSRKSRTLKQIRKAS